MTAPEADHLVVAQIVEAARKYFLRFGYSRVSTEEIARSIGRSKKTLYKHFATKEMLLNAVLARVDEEACRDIGSLLGERGGDRLARLRRILGAVGVHLTTTHQVLLADLRSSAPELGLQAWNERRDAIGRVLQPVLAEAAREGLVRADLPPERMLMIFFACVEGVAAPAELAAGAAPGGLVADLVNLLVDGLRRR